ncbi:hypothetical protein PP1Y_AT1927 [Novosphingobium sp. PP1Y]|nr:hypothetical protein PP1Y_AT1927 [Novosphingobium sp. PP1Y]
MSHPCLLPAPRASVPGATWPIGLWLRRLLVKAMPFWHLFAIPPKHPEVAILKQRVFMLAALALSACSTPYAGPDMPKGTALPPPEETAPAASPEISVDTMKAMVKTLASDEFEGRASSGEYLDS